MRLKHFLSVFLTLLTLSVGQMWGTDETITFSSVCSADEDLQAKSKNGTNFSVYFNKGTNSNKPVYKTTGSAVRVYGGGYFTVSSTTKTIKKIELTFGSGDGSNAISTDVGSYSSSTWTGTATSVKFTVGGSSGHRRLASVAVTYESGCTGTKLGTPVVTAEVSNQQIKLTWPAVSNASSYQLKWNGGSWEAATSPVTQSGLSNGTAYTYQVKAIGNGSTYCDGDASEEASATPNLYHTVTWNTHNGEFATTQVLDNTKPTFPKVNDEDPESCDDDADKFYGWSTTTFNKTDDISEKNIYTSASDMPKVTTDNVVYYAVFTDVEETDYSTVYSSNVTLPNSGTNVASASLTIGSTSNIPAVKLGKNGSGASCSISIPSGTTKLYLHAAGWNGKSSTLQLSTSVGTISPSTSTGLISNSGIANNSPFTLNTNQDGFDIDDYFYEYTLSSVTTPATITITVGTERGVIWGVNAISGSSLGDGNYLTNCCNKLASINGSFSFTNVSPTSVTVGVPSDYSDKNNENLTGYIFKRYAAASGGNALETIETDAANKTTATFSSGLVANTTYYYTITAKHESSSCNSTETSPRKSHKIDSYVVSYANGGGSGTPPGAHNAVLANETVDLKSNTFDAPTGKEFKAWNDGTSDFDEGETYTVTANKTMTAQWQCLAPGFTKNLSTAQVNYLQGQVAATLSITAAANGASLSYAWEKSSNGTTGWSSVGTNSNEYTPSTATAGDQYYHCIVTNLVDGCTDSKATSAVAHIHVDVPAACLQPSISVASGTYYEDKTVTITCGTVGAAIYYTTDGSTTPTSGSTLYEGAITVDHSMTIKAIAIKAGMDNSTVAEATYTIKCEEPTIVLAAGNYTGVQTTTITKGYGTKIYYTTDGSTPSNTNGTEYTEAVSIDQPMTLKAIVWKDGCTNSEVASAAYTLNCTTPTFNYGTGTYTGAQSITLSGTADADIYYTLDGTAPSKTNGTKYTADIEVSANQTVKAIAVKEGWGDSEIASATYTIQYNVYWWVNSADWNDKGGSTLVTYGQTATAPTTAPTKANGCGDKFMGWTEIQNYEDEDTAPTGMFTETSAAITGETNFYAVFADYGE